MSSDLFPVMISTASVHIAANNHPSLHCWDLGNGIQDESNGNFGVQRRLPVETISYLKRYDKHSILASYTAAKLKENIHESL